MSASSSKTVSLVLGSGGARGLAHIGVIRCLEENGFQIASIAGCSMGALVGGIYAAGKLDLYERWARKMGRFGLFSLLDFSFGRGGLVKGERLMTRLRDLVGETQIEALPIPFTAVAADIAREREVWIGRGFLFDAIRASISMPLFFTPFDYRGVRLIDGAVFNPVPVAPTFRDLTDITIAVSTNGPPEKLVKEPTAGEGAEAQNSFSDRIRTLFGRAPSTTKEGEPNDHWDLSYVVGQSFDAMQGVIARQKLAAHPPDVLIEIPQNACGILEFDRADDLIALGHARAGALLSEMV